MATRASGFSGNDLRSARVARGIRAADLVAPLGVKTPSAVRRIEREFEVSPTEVARYYKALAHAARLRPDK